MADAGPTGAEDPRALFNKGNQCFASNEYETALSYFERAIRLLPNHAQLRCNAAATLGRLRRHAEAEREARRAVELKPEWSKARFRLFEALNAQEKTLEAFQEICAACERERDPPPPWTEFRAASAHKVLRLSSSSSVTHDLAAATARRILDSSGASTTSRSSETDSLDSKKKSPIPVTLLSGFLGAGKTTLMLRVLREARAKGWRVAVVVNDMSELNIDAEILSKGEVGLVRGSTESGFVELTNGCICCTLREDLVEGLLSLATQGGRYDLILIESTGISEPLPVAQAFSHTTHQTKKGSEQNTQPRRLEDHVRLDTCVTVVDVGAFHADLSARRALKEREEWGASPTDARTIADLLADQVEFADVILLNKADLCEDARLTQVKAWVAALNPRARVFVTVNGENVDLSEICLTGLFRMDLASKTSAWQRELLATHVPETIEYGITSFVYRSDRPFDGPKLDELLSGERLSKELGVIRSKGYAWIAQDDRVVLEWSSAGSSFRLKAQGFWTCAVATRPEDTRTPCEPSASDRKLELCFIGVHLDVPRIRSAMDSMLCAEGDGFPESPVTLRTREGVGKHLFDLVLAPLYERLGPERVGLLRLMRESKAPRHQHGPNEKCPDGDHVDREVHT